MSEGKLEEYFSFPGGNYIEQNLLVCSLDEEWMLTQQVIQKSMISLESYKRLPEKYIILYQNMDKPKFSMSKKLDIKYIYNVLALSNKHAVVSKFDTRAGNKMVAAWRQYEEQKEMLEKKKKVKLEKFDQRADNFERFQHESFYTNEERFFRGKMDLRDYNEESFTRHLFRGEVAQKIDDQIAGLARNAEYITQQSLQESNTIIRESIEAHEKFRYMPVAEVVYLDGSLLQIVAYKTPQKITEVEWKDRVSMAHIKGRIFSEKILMERTPEYEPLAQFCEQIYGVKVKRV